MTTGSALSAGSPQDSGEFAGGSAPWASEDVTSPAVTAVSQ